MILRIIFSIVLVVHGLIHLMGFFKECKPAFEQNFDGKSARVSPPGVSRMSGTLWLLCSIGMIGSCVVFLWEIKWWWIPAGISVLTSQLLILVYWRDAKYGTFVNGIIVVILFTSYHQRKFEVLVENDTRTLLASQDKTNAATVSQASIQHLPNTVQKWLIRSGVITKKRIQTVHLKQKGMMRSKPGGKWISLEAEQYITADEPGFVWNAVMNASPVTIHGRDRYIDGKGNMLIKAMATIPLANSTGDEIDQGAMMRYLAEIVWVPTTALTSYIHWEAINDTTARATMTYKNRKVSGLFFFNHEGDVSGFEGQRFGRFEGEFSLETWSVKILGHKEFNGIRVGNECEVTWKLKHGDFTWLRLEVIDITVPQTK
jgi:hypothetical protein